MLVALWPALRNNLFAVWCWKLPRGSCRQEEGINKMAKMALYRSPDYQTNLSQLAFREGKNRFSRWTILAILDLQVTPKLPTQSTGLLVQEKKWKTDLWYGRHVAILDFRLGRFYFIIYKSPWCFLPSFVSIRLSVQEKKFKICFQEFQGFPIGVTFTLPTKFQVNWPFRSGEAKNRFSRWRPPWSSIFRFLSWTEKANWLVTW